ncbi:MAG TPA: type II toxin-antitoxin system HigB family toxin [Ktedonobacterales bacterium]|jgi:HTH-type transcriptional regulator/antitoxin HigA
MHIITKRTLKAFWAKYPDAETPLDTWYRIMKKGQFTDFAHLKQTFSSADYVGKLTVFDIGGNKYRLIASIHYNTGQVYIRNVLTHAEYDKGDCEEVTQTQRIMPEPQALSQAWLAFKNTVGITSIKTEEDYEQVVAVIDYLLDIVEDDEDHPLVDVLHYFGDLVERWEDVHVIIPDVPPREVLHFLMEQHSLAPEDLADYAPPNKIAEILAGKRAISVALAKKLAQRFHVHADLFL